MAEANLCAVEGCGKPMLKKTGLCSAHYQRKRKYGSPTAESPTKGGQQRLGRDFTCEVCGKAFYVGQARMRQAAKNGKRIAFCSNACYGEATRGVPKGPGVQERFWSKVDRGSDDECWPWTAATHPDGYGQFGFEGIVQNAHRVAYVLAHGEFDRSLEIRHSCDNPPCCNPGHLLVGTHTDNMRDMAERGRGVYPDGRGEANGMAKLSNEQVRAIRVARAGGETIASIAVQYGVSRSAISLILSGQTWSSVV